ncbi:hypothetical protein HY463_01690 [Candidatus Peregrinibacteria bacterium]|nr:hypothetical protein [Candidatus Peregrinibacteria bacterium]
MDLFQNKNIKKGLLISVFLGVIAAFTVPEAFAAFIPLPDNTNLNLPAPVGDTAVDKFENFLGPVARTARIIAAAVAVIMMVISGFTMSIAGDNEGTVKTQKQSITWGIIGLFLISIAGPVAEVFDYRQGNFLESGDALAQRAEVFDNTVKIVITFIKYLLGALATLMFIRAGAVMISSSSSEEDISREKKNLALGAGGLILVFASDLLVRRVLYSARYNTATSETVITINQNEFVKQLVAITNLIVSFAGPAMVLGFVIGGVLYISAAGDDGRIGMAKKIMMNSLIGIVIIYGAFALVSTVISGAF